MKYLYSVFLLFAIVSMQAQIEISFEQNEGFVLGSIHEQNTWEATEASDGIVENQIISNEKASDGTYSFKNGYESNYDFQWFPIFGAVKAFDTPMNYEDFDISYDILVTDKLGADFEFVAYTIIDDEFVPVAGVGIENRGGIYIIKDEDYNFEMIDAQWEPNTWVNVGIEVNNDEIKYYIDKELKLTLDNYTESDIHGFNMLHNNYGNDAYYDNIKINTRSLSVEDQELTNVKIFPNPTTDFITIQLPNGMSVEKAVVYNLLGKKLSAQKTTKIDMRDFPSGTYILELTTDKGKTLIRKIIKK